MAIHVKPETALRGTRAIVQVRTLLRHNVLDLFKMQSRRLLVYDGSYLDRIESQLPFVRLGKELPAGV